MYRIWPKKALGPRKRQSSYRARKLYKIISPCHIDLLVSLSNFYCAVCIYLYVSLFLFFLIQMETGDEFFNFHFIRNWSPSHERSQIKISQFTKFELLSLECNRVEGFQKLKKLESLYGFNLGRRHLGIRDICMEYGRPLTGRSLVTTQ